MLVIELKNGTSVPLPGARYLRREGESLIVENAARDVMRVFVRADVNALRIGPDDQRKSMKQAA